MSWLYLCIKTGFGPGRSRYWIRYYHHLACRRPFAQIAGAADGSPASFRTAGVVDGFPVSFPFVVGDGYPAFFQIAVVALYPAFFQIVVVALCPAFSRIAVVVLCPAFCQTGVEADFVRGYHSFSHPCCGQGYRQRAGQTCYYRFACSRDQLFFPD